MWTLSSFNTLVKINGPQILGLQFLDKTGTSDKLGDRGCSGVFTTPFFLSLLLLGLNYTYEAFSRTDMELIKYFSVQLCNESLTL